MTKQNKGLRKGLMIIKAPMPKGLTFLCPKCGSDDIVNKIRAGAKNKCNDCHYTFKYAKFSYVFKEKEEVTNET